MIIGFYLWCLLTSYHLDMLWCATTLWDSAEDPTEDFTISFLVNYIPKPSVVFLQVTPCQIMKSILNRLQNDLKELVHEYRWLGEVQIRAPAVFARRSQLKWFGQLARMPHWHLHGDVTGYSSFLPQYKICMFWSICYSKLQLGMSARVNGVCILQWTVDLSRMYYLPLPFVWK